MDVGVHALKLGRVPARGHLRVFGQLERVRHGQLRRVEARTEQSRHERPINVIAHDEGGRPAELGLERGRRVGGETLEVGPDREARHERLQDASVGLAKRDAEDDGALGASDALNRDIAGGALGVGN